MTAANRGSQRIAIFLPDFGGGGAERVQLVIIEELIAAGHQVDLVLALEGGALLPLLPPSVRLFELRSPRLAAALPRLVRYLRTEKPDTLKAVMWPNTVIAVLARMLARSPARLMVADHTALSREYREPGPRRILKATIRLFYPRADQRIICAHGAADDLARVSGISRESIEVLYNPLSLPAYVERRDEPVWQGATKRIVTVGSLKEPKNHALLLRAFAIVRQTHQDARLVIVGEGPLRADLEKLREELKLTEHVTFAGFHLDPWPFLFSADLFALSSDYEGLPLVLVEALHAGLRIVSTDCISGPREILDGGRFGRLVPVGDAKALAAGMVEALEEPANAERQRIRAGALAGKDSIRRYLDLLTGAAT